MGKGAEEKKSNAREVLIIRGRLDNLNDYTRACRATGWQKGAAMKEKNEDIVKGCILEQFGKKRFTGQVEMHFKWVEPNKNRDLDNICFAKKFILDALQSTGTIEGDGWKHIKGFTDTFEIDKDNPRIEVTIEGSMTC